MELEKTTLLELIWGNKTPQNGKIHKNHSMKVAYFTQHHIQQLDFDLTPIEHLQSLFPTIREEELRTHLANFGLVDYLPLQKMKTLSGGEKSRVVFATITMEKPQLLLLDEASNHLDSFTQEVLIEALKKFNGALILVSHDQRFISSLTNKFWIIENKKVFQPKVSFEDYLSKIKEQISKF